MNLKEKMIQYVGSSRRKSVYVPEFDDSIYFNPITVLQMDKIMTLSQGSSGAIHIWTIIEKAEHEDGSKAFGLEDKPFLEQLDWAVVTRITGEMLKTSSVDELKKTSEKTGSD